MSTANISYSSLGEASSEAKQVSTKLSSYADKLNSAVYKKLDNYDGSYTSNISITKSKTNTKISELETKAKAYSQYAEDLTALKEECLSTDTSVKSTVSQLTANFKQANGIRNSKVENTVNYFLTSFGNTTSAGRWVGNKLDKVESIKDYIKQSLEEKWDYDGGKQLVQGVLLGAAGVALGVIAVATAWPVLLAGVTALAAGAIGAGFVVALAGGVAGVIMAANGGVNIRNERKAYNETHNNADPALGRRLSDEDTIQDTIRRESDSSSLHKVATGIDIVNLVCTAVTVVDGAGKLIKNGFKWATENISPVEDLKVKDILSSKDNWSQFFNKTKTSVSDGLNNVEIALKMRDFNFIKDRMSEFGTDFMSNLKDNYLNFGKDGMKSTKNILNASKNLVSDGLDPKNFLEDIVFPGITAVEVTTLETDNSITYRDEELKALEKVDSITFDDIYDIGDKIIHKIIGSDVFSSDSIINKDALKVLGSSGNIDISVPETYVPSIDMSATRD